MCAIVFQSCEYHNISRKEVENPSFPVVKISTAKRNTSLASQIQKKSYKREIARIK